MTKLHDLPDDILYCLRGARGHQWEEFHPIGRPTEWGQPIDFRCARCAKERRDVYDSTGALSYRMYEVPKSYPDLDAYTTEDVRLEVVRRARARARRAGLRVVRGRAS